MGVTWSQNSFFFMSFKKRKLDDSAVNLHGNHLNGSISDLELTYELEAHELELEIRLKQRLAATLESRITWALILQESLTTTNRIVSFPLF
jgi:hypothetical protein